MSKQVVGNTIEISKLSYQYPSSKKKNLDNISLTVTPGSVWGLLGPNGAGKTTLIRCITGLLTPPLGTLKVFGSPPNREMLRNMGVLIENAGIYKKMKPREYLTFFGNLFDVNEPDKRIDELAEMFDMKVDSQRLGKLSLGQKQLIQLMRSLLARPKLIVWDEPFSNLDPLAQEKVKDVIQLYSEKWGSSVLIATHLLNQADMLCDNVLFIDDGASLYHGTKNHLYHRDDVLKCVSIGLEAFQGELPLKNWQEKFQLNFDYSERPLYLDRRRQNRGDDEGPKLYVSGKNLEEKISDVVGHVIQEGYAIKSVMPEKKDLYNLYTDLMKEKT